MNVIFEDGLFQSLVKSPDHVCKALICVREDQAIAGQPFFDIGGERLSVIGRGRNRVFLEDEFKEGLERMIDEALN